MPEFEISDINPQARRVPGGIWNQDVLPATEWEIAEHRVVVAEDLQRELGMDLPILRWAEIKFRATCEIHDRDLQVIMELTRYLSNWAYVGEETGSRRGQFRVLFQDDSGRWYAITLGPDRNGSINVITVFGGSDRGFLRNRLRHLVNVVEREK